MTVPMTKFTCIENESGIIVFRSEKGRVLEWCNKWFKSYRIGDSILVNEAKQK